jgi:2-polyprenyl-6-methoxyphenol hydroxylase-like FAD-dependent oxidoreductase
VERYDVVIAGGGIGGSGAATVLARAGLSVCVVEPTTEYPDIVRGEWLAPWGVAHAQATGLYDDLIAAGGHHLGTHVAYDEHTPTDAVATLPLEDLLPGVPGPLAIRHPVACQALADAAVAAGATMHRGATDIALGPDRELSFVVDGEAHTAAGSLVIGADGRSSSVRKAIGIELERVEHGHFLAGVLVDGLDFLGDDTVEFIATEGGRHLLCFPQGAGRARLYLAYEDAQADRYAGTGRAQAYLEAFVMGCVPGSKGFPTARVAGPAKGYRSVDTWCERPFVDGVVLLGDAAGHNDPLIGQGLSITHADIRGVTEAMLATDDWGPVTFEAYGRERLERMRRLRTTARVYSYATAGFYGARDPEVRRELGADPTTGMLLATTAVGPHLFPAEAYDPAAIDALLPAG